MNQLMFMHAQGRESIEAMRRLRSRATPEAMRAEVPALAARVMRAPALMMSACYGCGPLRADEPFLRAGGAAIIPIHGAMYSGFDLYAWYSGMTSYQDAASLVRMAADSDAERIVLDIDSPGGNTTGVHELYEAVAYAAARKQVVAVARYWMCSAAYYIASPAAKIIALPGSIVGSIGCAWWVDDTSKMFEEIGIERIVLGEEMGKMTRVEGVKQTPEMLESDRAIVRTARDEFFAVVTRHRGISAEALKAMDGGAWSGQDLLDRKLVDELVNAGDLAELIAQPVEARAAASGTDPDQPPRREEPMDLKSLTEAQLKEGNPALHKLIHDAGAASAREAPATIDQLEKEFAENPAFILAQVKAGSTMSAARAAYGAIAAQSLKEAQAQLAAAQQEVATLKAAPTPTPTPAPTPAKPTLSAPGSSTDPVGHNESGNNDSDYMSMVKAKTREIMEQDKCSPIDAAARAHPIIAKAHPEKHAAWLESLAGRARERARAQK